MIRAEIVDGFAEDGDPELFADELDKLQTLAKAAQTVPRLPADR